MRISGSTQPVLRYALPPAPPKPVADAYAEFQRLALGFDQAREALREAKAGVTTAQAADVRAVVDAAKEQREVADPQANEKEARAEVGRLEAQSKGLGQAVDEAGNELVRQVELHRNEWLSELAEVADAAAAPYDAAIAEARAALKELVPSRSGRHWLANFDRKAAASGRFSQFSGGRLRVSGRGTELRGEWSPELLLTVAAKVTAPLPGPKDALRAKVANVA